MSRWLVLIVVMLFCFLPLGCQSADKETPSGDQGQVTPIAAADSQVPAPASEAQPATTTTNFFPSLLGAGFKEVRDKISKPDSIGGTEKKRNWICKDFGAGGSETKLVFNNEKLNRAIWQININSDVSILRPEELIPPEIWQQKPLTIGWTYPVMPGRKSITLRWKMGDSKDNYFAEVGNSGQPVIEEPEDIDKHGNKIVGIRLTDAGKDFRSCDQIFRYGYIRGDIPTYIQGFYNSGPGGYFESGYLCSIEYRDFPK